MWLISEEPGRPMLGRISLTCGWERLPWVLLLLAHFGEEGKLEPVIPKISQETLAEMIGPTCSRVSFFLNKFRKLGFLGYNDGMNVHSSLLNIVPHD